MNTSLNVFTTALRAWFDIAEWRKSDAKYNWTLAQLARLPVKWYGGADLSKMHDLTACCLFGHYKGVDIIIPHCWFPRPAAEIKANKDQIPLFGWKDDGWLDMTNDKVTNYSDIVRWFKKRRAEGFRLRRIGHDPKFCREYFVEMKRSISRSRLKCKPLSSNPRGSAISKSPRSKAHSTICTLNRWSIACRTSPVLKS